MAPIFSLSTPSGDQVRVVGRSWAENADDVAAVRELKVRFDMDHNRIKKIVEFIASLLIEADAPALLREKFGYLNPGELKVVTEWLRAMAEQNFAEADALRREDRFQPYRTKSLLAASAEAPLAPSLRVEYGEAVQAADYRLAVRGE